MSVIEDLARFWVSSGDISLLAHPLAPLLLWSVTTLGLLGLRRQRQRVAVSLPRGMRRPALTAESLRLAPLLALKALKNFITARGTDPSPQPASTTPTEAVTGTNLVKQTSPAPPPRRERGSRLPDPPVMRPVGLPQSSNGRMGLAQITLRTTQRCRIFGLSLFTLALTLALGAPLALPDGAEPSLAFRIFTSGLVLLALWHLLWTILWRLDYDSIGLSCRNRWLCPEARMWRSLTGISSDGPFITLFHFADGLVMRVPTTIRGRSALMQTARSWLHHSDEPQIP